jgi:hypothetical protein
MPNQNGCGNGTYNFGTYYKVKHETELSIRYKHSPPQPKKHTLSEKRRRFGNGSYGS